jgi:hypothetical protein
LDTIENRFTFRLIFTRSCVLVSRDHCSLFDHAKQKIDACALLPDCAFFATNIFTAINMLSFALITNNISGFDTSSMLAGTVIAAIASIAQKKYFNFQHTRSTSSSFATVTAGLLTEIKGDVVCECAPVS